MITLTVNGAPHQLDEFEKASLQSLRDNPDQKLFPGMTALDVSAGGGYIIGCPGLLLNLRSSFSRSTSSSRCR